MSNTTRPTKKRPPSDAQLERETARILSLNTAISRLFAALERMEMPPGERSRIVWGLSDLSRAINARAMEVLS